MKKFKFNSREEFQHFIDTEKEKMYELIWSCIEESYRKGKNSAHIAEVYLEEESVYVDIISDVDEWEGSLTLAEKYYAVVEKYENSSKIRDLVKEIKQNCIKF